MIPIHETARYRALKEAADICHRRACDHGYRGGDDYEDQLRETEALDCCDAIWAILRGMLDGEARPPAGGPLHFRVPSSILWVNDGWKECYAASPDAALAFFIGRGWTGGLAHLQQHDGVRWGTVLPLNVAAGNASPDFDRHWRW